MPTPKNKSRPVLFLIAVAIFSFDAVRILLFGQPAFPHAPRSISIGYGCLALTPAAILLYAVWRKLGRRNSR